MHRIATASLVVRARRLTGAHRICLDVRRRDAGGHRARAVASLRAPRHVHRQAGGRRARATWDRSWAGKTCKWWSSRYPRARPATSKSQCADGFECVCGPGAGCAPAFVRGLCSTACDIVSCGAGAVCASLAIGPVAPDGGANTRSPIVSGHLPGRSGLRARVDLRGGASPRERCASVMGFRLLAGRSGERHRSALSRPEWDPGRRPVRQRHVRRPRRARRLQRDLRRDPPLPRRLGLRLAHRWQAAVPPGMSSRHRLHARPAARMRHRRRHAAVLPRRSAPATPTAPPPAAAAKTQGACALLNDRVTRARTGFARPSSSRGGSRSTSTGPDTNRRRTLRRRGRCRASSRPSAP